MAQRDCECGPLTHHIMLLKFEDFLKNRFFDDFLEGRTHYFKSNDYCVLEVIGITFFPSKSCSCKSPENSGFKVVR